MPTNQACYSTTCRAVTAIAHPFWHLGRFITGFRYPSTIIPYMVVVDRFSKGAHFGVVPRQFLAYKVANLFLDTVCKLHGFPQSLVSDREPLLINNFWRELFRISGTSFRMSTAYHPQSDGQTEVMNRILE